MRVERKWSRKIIITKRHNKRIFMHREKKNNHFILPHSGENPSHYAQECKPLCICLFKKHSHEHKVNARFLWLRESEESSRCTQRKVLIWLIRKTSFFLCDLANLLNMSLRWESHKHVLYARKLGVGCFSSEFPCLRTEKEVSVKVTGQKVLNMSLR